MTYLMLFSVFFRIGLFTIGGGLASLPLLYNEMVDGGFLSRQEFIELLEFLENRLEALWRNPPPGINHPEKYPTIFTANVEANFSLAGEFHSVTEQVFQYLAEARGISRDGFGG